MAAKRKQHVAECRAAGIPAMVKFQVHKFSMVLLMIILFLHLDCV